MGIPCFYKLYKIQQTHLRRVSFPAPAYRPVEGQLGGRLLSGSDPTGSGEVLSGFGDRREIELPVDTGFSRGEAIKIATLKGAVYLGKDKQIGSTAVG